MDYQNHADWPFSVLSLRGADLKDRRLKTEKKKIQYILPAPLNAFEPLFNWG
jgi:hypothetical protein